jgi:hypothetical protein
MNIAEATRFFRPICHTDLFHADIGEELFLTAQFGTSATSSKNQVAYRAERTPPARCL